MCLEIRAILTNFDFLNKEMTSINQSAFTVKFEAYEHSYHV